ncbi:MAG: hypothetical protein JXR86_18220 [Spirochaetales bacterium]|nr:hypothetical protein [Spirochaetales bacterium]
MKLAKIVGITGSAVTYSLGLPFEAVGINAVLPEETGYALFSLKYDEKGKAVLCLEGQTPGRGILSLSLEEGTISIPYVVFRERETFLALVISSNFHDGFDPESYTFGSEDNPVSGHGYFKAKRTLGELYHSRNYPVTWLIDPVVARQASEDISDWHFRYFDDYGIMPSSFFNHNAVNYNLEKSPEETKAFLAEQRRETEKFFDFPTKICGIDQWVGSVGNRFARAASELGFEGIWGMGYDHFTCDTSMFHRGCPWDMYKPDPDNVRLPSASPSRLWAFQWTSRDLINTVHTPTGSSGSVVFSTDPDDIRQTNIMASQADYYNRMLAQYHRNRSRNKSVVFLIHQEDHDMHFEEDNRYLVNFLDHISEEVTPATLEEIAVYMNLRHKADESSAQFMEMEDPLTCQKDVHWGYGGVLKPADWTESGYGTHVFYHDRDWQAVFQYPGIFPWRLFDYRARRGRDEQDEMEALSLSGLTVPVVFLDREMSILSLSFSSSLERDSFPLCFWKERSENLKISPSVPHIAGEKSFLLFLDIKKGKNHFEIPLL